MACTKGNKGNHRHFHTILDRIVIDMLKLQRNGIGNGSSEIKDA